MKGCEAMAGISRTRAASACLLAVTSLIVGLLSSSADAADTAMARGAALAYACAACHGADGRSQGAIPSINQLPVGDFAMALKAFRTDARQGTVMNRIAKGLDDAEISAMAAYFAARQRQ